MTNNDIRVLMQGIAPVLKRYVDEQLAPVRQRLDVVEFINQQGTVKRALPVVRVPCRTRQVTSHPIIAASRSANRVRPRAPTRPAAAAISLRGARPRGRA